LQLEFPQKSLKKETLLKNSKYTLSANLVNQVIATSIFLVVPNILGQNNYAQVVYISVLMSFMVLFDFGMGFVYGRVMPSIYHSKNQEIIEEYNQTFFLFRLIMSLIGSVVIGFVYYMKYENILNAFFLIFLNPLSIIIKFSIQQYSVQENFLVYRNINIKNSVAKILLIPFSYFFGVSGWISAQVFSSLFVIQSIQEKIIPQYKYFNYKLLKKYFREGIILLANFFFWNQLLNSGRLYASIYFDEHSLSQYGITNAGYTLLLTLVISIFLPVTVATLKIMNDNTKDAIKQLFDVIIKISIPLSIIVIIAIEVTPSLYKIFFPKYNINFEILKYQLLSLMALPLVVTLGNIFLGLKQPFKLLILYSGAFFFSYLIFRILLLYYGDVSAAIAQFIGVTFLGISMFISIILFYSKYIENIKLVILKILGTVFMPYLVYFIIRSFI